jgi:hypothetical protein
MQAVTGLVKFRGPAAHPSTSENVMSSEKDTPPALARIAARLGQGKAGRAGKVNECYQARDHGVNDVAEKNSVLGFSGVFSINAC